ncbi:hypothetical protein [Candidatus Leptofilum sp.]
MSAKNISTDVLKSQMEFRTNLGNFSKWQEAVRLSDLAELADFLQRICPN